MLFNSFSFLIFFPLVAVSYYLLPRKLQPFWLLLASCYFYMAFVPKYILVLFALITIDFFLGLLLERSTLHKRALLWVSIGANVGMLFFFKYFNFFNANISELAHLLHWNYSYTALSILLPLGLSFHVFQSLSYVIEVYRGKFPAERNYFIYALYVMFFPQLVAGPIERPAHLLPQFRLEHRWDEARVIRGLERMAWGFFKKLVIADNIAQAVNYVYSNTPHNGPVLIVTSILFAYQLYCDFSGYSDIAVGTALVLGYDIMENFDRPYASASITEFWRRWHISLSSWFRDYFFAPLAFTLSKKLSRMGVYMALFATFVIIGLWHGAAWTFVLLGVTHGIYIITSETTKQRRDRWAEFIGFTKIPRVRRAWQQLCVFVLVSFSWIFFRADTIGRAFEIIKNLGSGFSTALAHPSYWHDSVFSYNALHLSRPTMAIIALSILVLEVVQLLQANAGSQYFLESRGAAARTAWRYALVVSILCFGYFGAQPFIYFKF